MRAPQTTPADRDAEALLSELSGDLMSPFCPGRTIASCPSKAARKLEERILDEAKSGKSREQIEQSLVSEYGPEIIGYRPPPSLMVATVVGGGLALSLLIALGRKWVRKSRPVGSTSSTAGPRAGLSASELDALEDALDDEDGF